MQKSDFEKIAHPIFDRYNLHVGRIISISKFNYKRENPNNLVVFNANIVGESKGKIWYGDLDITKEGHLLKKIARELEETLYVLYEMDGRFGGENRKIAHLIKKAVWNTNGSK